MNVGLLGLGKMGQVVAYRLHRAGHTVVGFDPDVALRNQVADEIGMTTVDTIEQLCTQATIFWLMVPAGKVVDSVIDGLQKHLKPGAIIIDGGNSHFADSIRRCTALSAHDIAFLDCGSSGGVHAKDVGLSLMLGGSAETFARVEPLLQALAAPGGYALVGPSGAGHYVKMVHNGIEYGLLQAYAEGFQLIKEGSFKDAQIDLEQLTRVWQNGSVVRSWILHLAHQVFMKDQNLTTIGGQLAEGGTGRWTVEEADAHNIQVPVIKESLAVRAWSRLTGGNYATKVVAMLRQQFGGHAVSAPGTSSTKK